MAFYLHDSLEQPIWRVMKKTKNKQQQKNPLQPIQLVIVT